MIRLARLAGAALLAGCVTMPKPVAIPREDIAAAFAAWEAEPCVRLIDFCGDGPYALPQPERISGIDCRMTARRARGEARAACTFRVEDDGVRRRCYASLYCGDERWELNVDRRTGVFGLAMRCPGIRR